MQKKRRWLWPSSESRFLRHDSYQAIIFSTCALRPEDVLVQGSDEEADEEQRNAKRRRVLKIGRSYLSGQPIFIPSARLRGPFGKTAVDEPAEETQKPSLEVDEVEETILPIVEEDKPVLDKLDEELLRMVDSDSDQEGVSVAVDNAHASPSMAVLVAPQVIHVAPATHSSPLIRPGTTETPDLQLKGPSKLGCDGGRHSWGQQEIFDVDGGLREAKRLSQLALSIVPNDNSQTSPPRLTRSVVAKGSWPQRRKTGQKRVSTGLDHDGSPFVFRRVRSDNGLRAHAASKSDLTEGAVKRQSTAMSSTIAPGASSQQGQVTAARTPDDLNEVPTRSPMPVTERKLGRLSSRKGIRSSLREQMERLQRYSDGQGIEQDSPDRSQPLPLAAKGVQTKQSADSISDAMRDGNSSGGEEGIVEPLAIKEEMVPFSTQAALREAHLDLIKSSPIKTTASPQAHPRLRYSADASQSPAPAITPFARLNEQWGAGDDTSQRPQISTQAMLDAFSPFHSSPTRDAALKSPTAARRDESPPQNLKAPSLQLGGVLGSTKTPVPQLEAGQPVASRPDAGWTFAVLDDSPLIAPASKSRPAKKKTPPLSRGSSSLKDRGFKVTKSASQTGPASTKGASLVGLPLTDGDVNRSVNRPPSFSLSQIVEELKVSDPQNIVLDKYLSQGSPYASKKPAGTASTGRRGSVIDWDEASVTSDVEPASPAKDSMPLPRPVALPTGSTESMLHQPSAPRARLTFTEGSQSPKRMLQSELTASSAPQRKSALRKTQRSSMQEGQREGDLDLDISLDELRNDVLGSWDIDQAMHKGVGAA